MLKNFLNDDNGTLNVVLYASNQTLVDDNLNYISNKKINIETCNLYYCISNNVVYGCTMIMNHKCRINVMDVGIKKMKDDSYSQKS